MVATSAPSTWTASESPSPSSRKTLFYSTTQLGEELDKVVGVANREKLLTSLLRGDSHLTPFELSENVEFVPEMIRVDRLLLGFNDDKKGVRVVVDEFGGFVGLVGAEAVLAVLAGWWRKSKA